MRHRPIPPVVSSFPAKAGELSHGTFREIKDFGIGLKQAHSLKKNQILFENLVCLVILPGLEPGLPP